MKHLFLATLLLSLLACSNGKARMNNQNPLDTVHKKTDWVADKEKKVEPEDPTKIYEQSELDEEAIPTFTNPQLLDLFAKHFKYPKIEPMNGRGECDLIIEKDGSISDVIIVKGIHPQLDAEFKRVLKMLPNFIPGKLNDKPVRSKFRRPMKAQAK